MYIFVHLPFATEATRAARRTDRGKSPAEDGCSGECGNGKTWLSGRGVTVPGPNDPTNIDTTYFTPSQMIETQAELRSALANIKELERNVRELEVQKIQLESKLSQTDSSEKSTLVEDLKTQVFTRQVLESRSSV